MTTEPGSVHDEPLIMALPNGRILGEVMPLFRRMGIEPEPAFDDSASRQLRFRTSEPGLDLIRVRRFDAATFVAFGAAQLVRAPGAPAAGAHSGDSHRLR